MEIYRLNVSANCVGGYFSSEQLELLSIIQCHTYKELINVISQCKQLNGIFTKKDLESFTTKDLEQLKRTVFKSYQDTLVPHNSSKEVALDNTLYHLKMKQEDIDVIKTIYNSGSGDTIKYIREYMKTRYPGDYKTIFKQAHRFVSVERDQNKNIDLYDEFVLINDKLTIFDTLLVGSGKPDVVINKLFDESEKERFDFYFARRDLDFAYRNNKHIRFHSLLTKWACERLFDGQTKKEILKTLTGYVRATIDFVNEYNFTHKLADGTSVIHSIDLFNEIVSFHKNTQGEFVNIWETKYGITIPDICNVFAYAKKHKPDGVSYLYNEPFLEDAERRKKVIEVLQLINSISHHLIDTIGSQMHITFRVSDEQIKQCFNDFKILQDTLGINIQITEFDLSLSEGEVLKTLGVTPQVSYKQVYAMKRERIDSISTIINNSDVRLGGVSYWSLTDKIDSNLERIRTNLLKKGIINDIRQISTTCGGLIPTSKPYLKLTE